MGNNIQKPEEIFKSIETQNMIKLFKKQKQINNYYKLEGGNHKKVDFYAKLNGIGKTIHNYYRYIWNGNFSSPIEEKLSSGAKVLDLGCGAGYWLMDLCNEYPKSTFVGIDLIPIPQNEKNNLEFINKNFLEGIPYEDNTFDFIYMKHMMNSINNDAEWRILLPEIFRVCKPGGWIEIMDSDENLLNLGPITLNFREAHTNIIGESRDIIIHLDRLHDMMNIFEIKFSMILEKVNPYYPFHPENSDQPIEIISDILNEFRPFMSNLLGMDDEEYTKLSKQMIEEIAKYKTYSKTYRMITQKRFPK